MVNFFRKKRKKLADDNHILKYTRYALGEILLVVIGILIALQINNWNENNKLIKKENDLIISLTKEIENNIELIKFRIDSNKIYLSVHDSYLKNYEIRTSINSSMFRMLMSYHPASINSPILNDIIGSDVRVAVANRKYFDIFRELKASYESVEKQEYYLDEFWNSKVTGFLIDQGLSIRGFESGLDIEFENKKLMTLSNNRNFLSLLSIKKTLQTDWFDQQIIAFEKSEEVLNLIKITLSND